MHINACEVFAREVRGLRLNIIVGPREVTPAEGSALLAQFYATHTGREPIYAHPGGWQVLEPIAAGESAAASEVPAEPAAAVSAPAKRRK